MSTGSVSSYGPIYGSLYFGTILSTAFYGVACMQTFFYYVHYQNDPRSAKIFIAALWALNTVHEAVSVAGAYKFLLAGLINVSSFPTGIPELIMVYLFTALVAVPAQGFFVYRIYVFSKRNILAPLLWIILALIQLACAAAYIARALLVPSGTIQVIHSTMITAPAYEILATVYLSIGAGADILIALCMSFLLLRERSTTNFPATAHLLQCLTAFAVNTGIWTATFALLSVILVHVFPLRMIHTVVTVPLCPVYCNAVLANLNARAYLSNEGTKQIDLDLFGATPGPRASVSSQVKERQETKGSARAGIWQTVEVLEFRDTCQGTRIE